MTVLFRFLSRLPLWLLHLLGTVLGWATYAASQPYRQRFHHNAALAGYTPRDVRGAVAHAGRMLAELPRLWLGAPLQAGIDNAAAVEQAYAAGRGVIFLTPHMGCFEMCAQALAARYGAVQGPLTVLYRPARQPWLARIMATARDRPGLLAAPTTLAGVRQMVKALRHGQAVGLLPDQVPPHGMGQWTPFFGCPAYTMTLAARLALQTGAAVVLVRCERLPRANGFVVHAQALAQPLAPALDAAVLQINGEMERLVRLCPQQYLWGYARYKQPRGDAVKKSSAPTLPTSPSTPPPASALTSAPASASPSPCEAVKDSA